ncbi:MAG: XrtA system polysaccharide chain length determinant [Pseudomonadota bacterium]
MREQLEYLISEARGMWRFRVVALIAAWLVCLGGWFFVLTLPDTYESTAQVYVDTNSQLRPTLEGLIVDTDVTDQLDLVTKALLGQQQLEEVVLGTNLGLRVSEQRSLTAVARSVRDRVSIKNANSDPNLYTLSFSDTDPQLTKVVVETLLNNFVENSLGANREGSENSQRFLREQLADLELELTEAERRLADFKRQNIGLMPGEGSDYYSNLQDSMDARDSLRSELSLLRSKRSALQAQLAGETPLVTASAETGPVADIDERLNTNRKKLEELSLRFTDRHPDVIQTKSVITELEQRREELLSEMSDSGGVASDNPVYQNIKIELNNIDVEIAAKVQEESVASQRIVRLQGLVDVLPQVEAELQRLNRDYGVKEEQYQSLSERLELAKLSDSADKSEDVQFQIINPPLVPSAPESPNRPLLLATVLALGLGAGGGVAFLISQIRPVFHHTTALRDRLGLPVLGSVSLVVSAERKKQRLGQLAVFSTGLLALVAAFLIVLVTRERGIEVVQSLMAAV